MKARLVMCGVAFVALAGFAGLWGEGRDPIWNFFAVILMFPAGLLVGLSAGIQIAEERATK